MNRRSLLMILLGTCCAPLPSNPVWAQQPLTYEKKKLLRNAIPYPEIEVQVKFSFSEANGVMLETSTSQRERNNAVEKKNQTDWQRLRNAPEPTEPEAKAGFYAERGKVAVAVNKLEEGRKDEEAAAGLYRDLAAKAVSATKKVEFLIKAAESGKGGKENQVDLAVADAREAVRLAPMSATAWRALGGSLNARFFERFTFNIGTNLGTQGSMQSTPLFMFFMALQNPALFRKVTQVPGFSDIQVDSSGALAAYRKAFELKPDAKGILPAYASCLLFLFLFDAAQLLPADTSTTAAFGESLAKAARQSDATVMLEKALILPVDPVDLASLMFVNLIGIGGFGQQDTEAALKNLLPSEKKLLERVGQRFVAIQKDRAQNIPTRISAILGTVLIKHMMQDEVGINAILKDARELAPQDIRILELSLAMASQKKDYAEAKRYAEALLQSRNIAFYHLLYARVRFYEGKPGAEKQAMTSYRAALKLEPGNVQAAIGLAVSLIKVSEDNPDLLLEAGLLLNKITQETNKTRSREDTLALCLASIGFYGLNDQLDEARTYLKKAQEYFPGEEGLKRIATIIQF